MKKLFFVLSACLLIVLPTQAQCDLEFDFVNTGSNMTAFFTPPAAAAIYSDLGDGQVGAFYVNGDGSYVCGSSAIFTGNQLQLAVMGDDATTPSKDGFSSGEVINWFYKSNDGAVHSLDLNPADNFVINAMTFIGSAVYSEVDCGGSSTDDECPTLETDFLNTGSNMTLFLTPNAATALSAIGNGVIAVYYEAEGNLVCAGSTSFTGSSAQIAANGDDATTTEKDGFSAGESIVWKFEDTSGNQYDLNPTPSDNFSLNGISFISGFTFQAISCSVDTEGCTDDSYLEYNSDANIDDGSCLTLAVYGCTGVEYMEYNALANVDDGSCSVIILEGCMDDSYVEYNSNATISDGSCQTLIVYGCTDNTYLEYNSLANTDDGSCASLIVNGCTDSNYVEYNSNANTDDGSCNTLIVLGCTDVNAENYNSSANTNDGSCEYDLIGAGCDVSFETVNTGSNHTIMIPASLSNALSVGDQVGVFFVGENGTAICAGSSVWTGQVMQIVAFGDDTTTDEVDGLSAGAPFLFLAQSGDDVYVVNATFQTPSMANYAVNGLSFVSDFELEIACTVQYLGCTDVNACNFDTTANTSDDSCEYAEANFDCNGACLNDSDNDGICDELEIVGCMDTTADNYNADATDAGACEYLGCTDVVACNYNEQATISDDSCEYADANFDCNGACLNDSDNDGVCDELEIVGCMDTTADNYNADATDAGACEYGGCTDVNYIEYDSSYTFDDGSCVTLIVVGCTDLNATNFDANANSNDGSCEYDLIGTGCDVSFETVNTGSNHTIMIPSSLSNTLNVGDQIGVFFLGENGSAICAGSSTWTGQVMQIVAFGDDTTTDEVDGLLSGAPFLFLAQSGDDVYVVNATFQSPSMSNYSVNGLSFVSSLQLELACSVEHLGCIDVNACNFDASANTDNGSCEYAEENLDCNGVCLNDSDNDGICNEYEISGCMDASASNFNPEATDADNSCVSWEDAYDSCVESGGDDGITQADVDAVQALLEVALANQDDGISQADVDVVQSDLNNANSLVADLEIQLATAIENQEDGVSQADVDAVQSELNNANVIVETLEAQLVSALANQDDGIGQADVDAAYADGVSSVVPEDGISQADVDAVQSDLDATNIELVNSQLDLAELQVLLDEALANTGGGSCEAIYVDLLSGWNIIGYTLTFNQDVAATLDPIVDDVQIVKNNAANVYWPEYGFNGIGDFIPGQGYQIRMYNEVSSYTFPDVDGLRINLTATVPAYVYDLPVLNHPNDIKSLVRVVNMLGQEVNPDDQFNGEVLLYLYNDGTTEKRIVE